MIKCVIFICVILKLHKLKLHNNFP